MASNKPNRDNAAPAFNKLAWLERIAFDLALTHFDVRVATALATRWLNRGTGDAWPAQETIAQATGATSEGVRKAIKRLGDRGHLVITHGGGRGRSNHYRPAMAPTGQPENPKPLLGVKPPKTPTAIGGNEPKTPNGCRLNPQPLLDKPPTDPATNPVEEPRERTQENPPKPPKLDLVLSTPEPEGAIDEAFKAWWVVYPRHVARKAALTAFTNAVRDKRATIEQLIDGARAYAGERAGKDPTKTAHGATWLNGDRWQDEPSGDIDFRHDGRRAYSGLGQAEEILSEQYRSGD